MALFPLQPGLYPLGQYDLLDTDLAALEGGEVMTLTTASASNSSTEQASYDARDGYMFDASGTINNRPVATFASTAAQFPLFLSDDGTAGYGTLFGEIIGTPVGLSTTGSNLGPNTAAASGKVTLWDKAGLYAVTTSSVSSDFITSISTGASAGLVPGRVLGFTSAGLLAHSSCSVQPAVSATGVAHFVEFQATQSLVNTPARLVGATTIYTQIVFHWNAGMGVRTL